MKAPRHGRHGCSCNHDDDVHLRRSGRCLGTDSYGLACECPSFEHSSFCIELDEDENPPLPPIREERP